MELRELVELLREYAAGTIPLATIHERLGPVLAEDPLDVSASDAEPWERAPDDTRLFWRLVYLIESADEDSPELRDRARRIVASLDATRSAGTTHELLPVILDAPRLCTIIEKHRVGVVSRTGFLSMVAESGYPAHVKLWLQHASSTALEWMRARLGNDAYDVVAARFESPPE
ncbi:MAG TPA: hypothetical protein VKA54_01540 [Gemmatimonadaceae bacterium]|nr:hypothetical protein [Gemmatimonadaceae bacterium]